MTVEAVKTQTLDAPPRADAADAGARLGLTGDESEVAGIEVILNASAGAGDCEQARALLQKIFGEAGVSANVRLARDGEEITALARRAALGARCRTVWAGGGDGTVSAVASLLVGTDKALGVLPLGTLNHFAKDLGLPLDLEEAARALLAGSVARVDAAEVNGRVFVNNSGLGLYPSIVRERERRQERHGLGKWAALAWATVTVLRRYPYLRVRLSADGRTLTRRTPFLFVGNNEYELDAFNIGSRARLDAGRLCLHLARRDTGRLGLARLALRALAGRLREDRDFESLKTEELTIETRQSRARVSLDGEVTVMQTPLRYRTLPGALRVVVPPGTTAVSDEQPLAVSDTAG
jgi:diacylglycerol kinase family enzyme